MKKFLSILCLLTIVSVIADTQVVYRYLNTDLSGKFDNKMEKLLSRTIINRCFAGNEALITDEMDILMIESIQSTIEVPEDSKSSFDTQIVVTFEFRDFNSETEEEIFRTVEVLIEKSSNPNLKDLMRIDISSASDFCQ
ncbi:hypothetical protein A9Q84_12740 [Halobacteriovorax marinus]|uniref:Uncharacterized protein n=1 Tax=Halobacteriovorax marinus TaxID=97084 RepID=A0A1Y5F8C1_9BACT|nr:hypothetical protein A9Q84_12740 [Halobacteriovorax marinus]